MKNEQTCKYCKYYDDDDQCRRYPPIVVADPQSETNDPFYTLFPKVNKDVWCGEFTPYTEDKNEEG